MQRKSNVAYFALAIGIAVAGAGCSRDNTVARNDQPVTGSADRVGVPVAAADRDFMTEAAQGGMTEVQLGQIAQEKGRSQAVKDFGKRLVEDHTTANNKLKAIAAYLGVTLPAALDSKHQEMVYKFAKMTGDAKFDREFMAHAIDDHKKDISEFEKASANAQNDRLKAFATETLPTLREHLQIAQAGPRK
jgi:putative membrane protein